MGSGGPYQGGAQNLAGDVILRAKNSLAFTITSSEWRWDFWVNRHRSKLETVEQSFS